MTLLFVILVANLIPLSAWVLLSSREENLGYPMILQPFEVGQAIRPFLYFLQPGLILAFPLRLLPLPVSVIATRPRFAVLSGIPRRLRRAFDVNLKTILPFSLIQQAARPPFMRLQVRTFCFVTFANF